MRPKAFLAALLLSLAAACAKTQTVAPETSGTQDITIVQRAYDSLNEGDVDGFLGFFSSDAVLMDSKGRAQDTQGIRAELVAGAEYGYTYPLRDMTSEGGVVTSTMEILRGGVSQRTHTDWSNVVVDGEIVFDGREVHRLAECQRDPSQRFCPPD